MRHSFSMAVILFMLMLTLVHPVAAQDTTPVADGTGSLTPTLGTGFSYVESEGEGQATITIDAVEDPVEDVLEGYEAEAGSRFVTLTVIYENTGPGPFETRPDAFIIQDSEGYMWSPTSIQRNEDVAVPDLQHIRMAPGDRVSGMVGFQVPDEAELARVFYQPESSRLLLLADLNVPSTAGPGIGTEVEYEDAETTAQGLVTVTEVEDPFDDVLEGYEAEEGSRYVLVTIAIENTGSVPLDVSPGTFMLRDANGFLWAYTGISRPDDVVVPDLQSQTLSPGSRISGVVAFQLPEEAEAADVLYQPVSGRLIFLAHLLASGEAQTSGGAAAAGADCAGLEAWYAETSQRMSDAIELSQEAANMGDAPTLEAWALEFADLAAAQEAMDVPPGAAELNDEFLQVLTDYHDVLLELSTAGDDSGDIALALVEGANTFNDTSRAFAALEPRMTELAESCGIET